METYLFIGGCVAGLYILAVITNYFFPFSAFNLIITHYGDDADAILLSLISIVISTVLIIFWSVALYALLIYILKYFLKKYKVI